ncbi:MAG: mechanosensitive ion channel family protein [Promethearchaeota archaeon]|nr:MAG: mechanosensitive ion channel family protein [Candidatus Lokiarchaeota archaeon]
MNGEDFWIAFVNFWIWAWTYIEPWLWLIITVVAILIAYKIIIFLLKRYVKKSPKVPKDATNGLILIIRLVTVIGLIFVVLVALNIPSEYLVDISTIIATAVGFASTVAVSNLVAGFYMILSRPYGIGDYISIDRQIEGLVRETSLNYTKIEDQNGTFFLIPNNKLLSANLINYCYESKKLKKKKESTEEEAMEEKIISTFSDILTEKEITKYVFEMEFPLDQDSEKSIEVLDQICGRWGAVDKFGYQPEYYFKNISYRMKIRWAITTKEPETMINNMEDFLKDIWISLDKVRRSNNL